MTETGERLETVRIDNDPALCARRSRRPGEHPEVVLEATYGWYWAADVLARLGAQVHLAHPLGVKGFAYRRVKNDERDAADLADLLRMGRLPEAWIAPPAVRELRELVRHRAKLVGVAVRAQGRVHAVLAKQGVLVPMTDLFGVAAGSCWPGRAGRRVRARVDALLRLIDAFDFEIDMFARQIAAGSAPDRGYLAIQQIPGVGPVLAAVFVAEIGEVGRFARPAQLAPGPGSPHDTASPTPPCAAGRSPSRAAA